MSTDLLIWPIVAQVLLSFVVAIRMAYERFQVGMRERIQPHTIATRAAMAERMPTTARSSDNFQNQFETPVLFIVAMLVAMQMQFVDPVLLGLAWVWVVLRHIHAVVHLTYNKVRHRFRAFLASVFVLAAIWGDIIYLHLSR